MKKKALLLSIFLLTACSKPEPVSEDMVRIIVEQGYNFSVVQNTIEIKRGENATFHVKKNPFSFLLQKELPIPDKAFALLGAYWMVFFFLSGLLNVVIAFYLPELIGVTESEAEALWVDYKIFGNPILNTIFALITGVVLIKKYPELIKEKTNNNN